jgi:hypothetical protein
MGGGFQKSLVYQFDLTTISDINSYIKKITGTESDVK